LAHSAAQTVINQQCHVFFYTFSSHGFDATSVFGEQLCSFGWTDSLEGISGATKLFPATIEHGQPWCGMTTSQKQVHQDRRCSICIRRFQSRCNPHLES
jgi:hypothetical protein